jgi:hypothetical protein
LPIFPIVPIIPRLRAPYPLRKMKFHSEYRLGKKILKALTEGKKRRKDLC